MDLVGLLIISYTVIIIIFDSKERLGGGIGRRLVA